jgi:hypothetical protein
MQHVTVAGVLGMQRRGLAAHIGVAEWVQNCLRLIPPFCFDHSICLVPEHLRGRPEYMTSVLRLTEVQHGLRYVD